MICFCAERFQWRRLWQNPGELLLPGLSDMATRALLYRRPAEPSTLVVKHGSQFFAIRLRRHRRARRYTLRIHPSDREAILTMPPRGTLAEAKDFARRQGQAAVDPRSVQPLGLLHLGGLAVVLLAPDPRTALRARLSCRPRSRP